MCSRIRAKFVNHFLVFLIGKFICRSPVSGKLFCQSIMAINERQRGQLFLDLTLFLWGKRRNSFVKRGIFSGEKFGQNTKSSQVVSKKKLALWGRRGARRCQVLFLDMGIKKWRLNALPPIAHYKLKQVYCRITNRQK